MTDQKIVYSDGAAYDKMMGVWSRIVGKKFLNETYSSLVLYYKEKNKILVTNIDGPLKHLKNEWKFKEINDQTQLEFDIDFELKNKLLNTIMKKSFNLGLNKIADAFEKRAIQLFKKT